MMRLYDRLCSWELSVVLTLTAGLYYVFLAIWSASAPSHVVQNISRLLPFLLLYILLLANTAFCIGYRLSAMLKAPSAAAASLLLHAAVLLLALGFFLSSYYRFEGKFLAATGEEVQVGPETYSQAIGPSSVSRFQLRVDRIEFDFWQDQLLFTKLESLLYINESKQARVAINRPVFLSLSTSLRVSSFGYAPSYLLSTSNVVTEEGAVRMRVFPPGQQDYFQPRHFPHRIYVKFYPDWQPTGDQPASRSMHLKNPRFFTKVYRGKIFLGERVLSYGESLTFEGITVAFLNVIPMAEFTVVRDPGFPLILLSFLSGIAGIILRL